MVMTTSCCFNPRPPTAPPSHTATNTQPPPSIRYIKLTSAGGSATLDPSIANEVYRVVVQESRDRCTPTRGVSWRNQCVVGMACVIIGLQVEGIVGNNHDYAVAGESKVVVQSKVKGKTWSGKRICPAWQLNSLETIVPEDLPRPAHKRRWEEIGDHLKVAPPVKASTTTITAASSDCFSM